MTDKDVLEAEIQRLKDEVNELKQYKERLSFIEMFSHEAFAVFDDNFKCLDINDRSSKMLGYSKEEIFGMPCYEFIVPEHRKFVIDNILSGEASNLDVLMLRKDGSTFWGRVEGVPLEHNGKKFRFVTCRDITDYKQLVNTAAKNNAEFETIFNNAMMGILLVGKNRTIYRVNQVLASMFGYDSTLELQNKSTRQLLLTDDLFEDFGRKFYPALKRQTVHTADIELMKKDGTKFWIIASGKSIDTNIPADLQLGVIWSVMDITERKYTEFKLLKMSRDDCLTNCFNRRYYYEQAFNVVSQANKDELPLALVFIDIDYFKRINDQHGHSVGDKALIYFVNIINDIVNNKGTLGRLGGEEFGICLPGMDLNNSVKIIEQIREKLDEVLPDYNQGIPKFTISAGVVLVKDKDDFESAVNRADDLLYKAKRDGRNRTKY